MSDVIDRLNRALSDRYRTKRELGRGAMATVYLAEDLRHERLVALKVLRPELSVVVGASRFLAEIKTTANLQHPHILPLYDSGESDGLLFYVMPYVEGESLRDRLDREKQLPVDEAVRLTSELADALDYAHRHGIVHRDIKPANILLHDGNPLLADFGIALAVGEAGGGRLTETGLSVGTPLYMSPEQASGYQNVGSTADLYALGCVLYEMLAGQPPYTGSTAQAVLARIITGDAAPVSEVRRTVPANVAAAVAKAIEKVPADRFRSAKELKRALEEPGFRHGSVASGSAELQTRRWKAASAFLALALALALVWLVQILLDSSEGRAGPALLHAELVVPEDVEFHWAHEGLAVSPDGSAVFYATLGSQGEGEIRMRILTERGSDRPIPGTQGLTSFALSPDGERIVFYHSPDSELKVVPVAGGRPRVIADTGLSSGGYIIGLEWAPDGTVLYSTVAGIHRVPASGGTPTQVTAAGSAAGEFHRSPRSLPDGSGIVFTLDPNSEALEDVGRVGVLPFGGEVTVLTEGHSPRVTESGVLLFSRGTDGDVWAARLSPGGTGLESEPVLVMDGGLHASWGGGATNARYAVGSDGTLLYLPKGALPNTTGSGWSFGSVLSWLDREGHPDTILHLSRLPNATGGLLGARLSPDGSRVAFRALVDEIPRYGLFVWDLERRAIRKISTELNADWPTWLDDERIIFNHFSSEGHNLYVANVDGSSEPGPWTEPNDLQQHGNDVTPDGSFLVLQQRPLPRHSDSDIWVYPVDGEGRGRPVFEEPSLEAQGAVDPSGRWLAYTSNRTGTLQVYVTEFPEGRTHTLISEDGGTSPVWNPRGGELFYRNGGEIWSGRVVTDPFFRLEDTELLFEAELPLGIFNRTFDVSLDGERFLASYRGPVIPGGAPSPVTGPARMEIIRGWADEVNRRLDGHQ